jgi:hypothetical protein
VKYQEKIMNINSNHYFLKIRQKWCKINILLPILACLSLFCSGSKDGYFTDASLLTSRSINSKDGNITFYIPVDWDSIQVVKNSNYDFILVDKEKKYSITLSELKAPFNIHELMENEGMKEIENIEYEMLKLKYEDEFLVIKRENEKRLNKYKYIIMNLSVIKIKTGEELLFLMMEKSYGNY